MKIAVDYDNGSIAKKFVQTKDVRIYDFRNRKLIYASTTTPMMKWRPDLAGFLESEGVSVLICGEVPENLRDEFTRKGIRLCEGVSGSPDEAVRLFLQGRLDSNPATE